MGPSDFQIDYKNQDIFVLNCWEVKWDITPETVGKYGKVVYSFNHAFRELFTNILHLQPNAIHMSTRALETKISNRLRHFNIPNWAKEIRFQLTKGKHHPYRYSRYQRKY